MQENLHRNHLVIKGKAYIGVSEPTVRWLTLILLYSFSIATSASRIGPVYTDSSKNVIIDYPQILQKAGVKKVRCIFKDSRKFVWIGTENGLYRYDGTNVDLLQHNADKTQSLPDNTVISITEDHAGQIWAGTLEGVARIDPWSFTCKRFNHRMKNLDQDFDLKVYVDKKGAIWAYGSKGLDRFDNKAGRFAKVWQAPKKDKSGTGYINSVTDWRNDTLVLGTFNGAILLNKNILGYRHILTSHHITVTHVFSDADHLWLGTWGYGCYILDATGKNSTIVRPEREIQGQLSNVITAIISTRYNNSQQIWISTLNGIYKAQTTSQIAPFHPIFKTIWSGPVNGIMADDEQYIWKAGNTVSRFFAGNTFFKTAPITISGTVQDICPVSINGQKAIAIPTWYSFSGLVITDTSGKKVFYRQPFQVNQDYSNIARIVQDKYKRLWISSLAGVEVLGPGFKQIYSSNKVTYIKDQPLSAKTNDILISHDTVWIVCYKRGINLYDLNFHKLKTFMPGDGSGLTDDYIQRLFADSHGHIWLCGSNHLYMYLKDEFRPFNFNKDGRAFTVNDIAELPDGDIMLASNSGLFQLNVNNFTCKRISSLLIDDNNIISVSIDANGDIWFINAEHLIYYQVKNRHFTLFGHEDGLNTASDLQLLRTVDKTLYLAANGRVVSFSPGKRTNSERPVYLYFRDIQVNDSTIAPAALKKELKLKYDQNRLNVGFGAINDIKPEQNLYAYQLTGVDDRWIYTSRNFASYANLAPGYYKLKVKAQNYAGIWSSPISMDITVAPPFWATWWFRLLNIILIGSVLFIAVRYVLQRNLRERILKLEKEQAIEKERNRIARDMHDDLGSGLTKIAILSEVAKTQVASAQASANLDVISNASRELVDNLQDIIWVLNPQNDSLNSLVLYIREYAECFFEPAGLQYEFSHDVIDGTITLSEEQRRNIFLAIKETCNNIMKHAGCTRVCISLKLTHNRLIISIKDNGCGFDSNEIGLFSNGLQNIRSRMNQIGAEVSIVSEKNIGTATKLTIPV